jgi:large subunit ribosomal protein L6
LVKTILAQEFVELPSDVEANVSDNHVLVKGPLGELSRDFSHARVLIRREDGRLIVEAAWPNKKRAATVGTIRSHIHNMITGVVKGFTVKLKIVFAHFPMAIKILDDRVVIENFTGERRPRTARIHGDVKIKVDGDDIILQGIDLEEVTQTAANIQRATYIKKKDPRVFLDGIYVFEKNEEM